MRINFLIAGLLIFLMAFSALINIDKVRGSKSIRLGDISILSASIDRNGGGDDKGGGTRPS